MSNFESTNEDFEATYKNENTLLNEGNFALSVVKDPKGTSFLSIQVHGDNDYFSKRTEEVKKIYSDEFLGGHKGFSHLVRIVHDTKTNSDVFLLDNNAIKNGLLIKYIPKPSNEQFSTENNTEIQALLIKLAQSISEAHSKNIVLRDVSFSNVGLDENNNPVILSLVPSCKNGDVAPFFSFAPNICPPEMKILHKNNPQIELKNLTIEVKPNQDIYVFGALILMLTGGSFNTIGFSLRTFAPAPTFIPVLPKHESEPVKELISSMLKPNPDERPTITEVLNKLKNGTAMLKDVDKEKLDKLLVGFE